MADGGSPTPLRHQRVVHCTACRHCNAACAPGLAFLRRLGAAVNAAPLAETFEISGSASLLCGAKLCPVVWRATASGAWLWGDVAPEVPIAVLIGAGNGPQVVPAAEIVTGAVVLQ